MVLKPKMTVTKVVSAPLYNLLLLNWYLLRVEMNLGQAHKTRFWYLLGVFSKFPTSTPVTFIGEYPPPPHFGTGIRHCPFSRTDYSLPVSSCPP